MRGAGGEGEDHHRHHCSTNYIQVREDVKKILRSGIGGGIVLLVLVASSSKSASLRIVR